MRKVLEGAGSGLEHVVKVNVFLTNMVRDFQDMNEVYKEVSSGSSDLYYSFKEFKILHVVLFTGCHAC